MNAPQIALNNEKSAKIKENIKLVFLGLGFYAGILFCVMNYDGRFGVFATLPSFVFVCIYMGTGLLVGKLCSYIVIFLATFAKFL